MKKPAIIIGFATVFMLFYNMAPYIAIPDAIIIGMFILSPFVIIYMAYVIIRYGKPSRHSFEEKFYDDLDYYRKEQ